MKDPRGAVSIPFLYIAVSIPVLGALRNSVFPSMVLAQRRRFTQDARSLSHRSSSSVALVLEPVTFKLLQHHINFSPSLPQPRILSLYMHHLDTIVQLHKICYPLHIRVFFFSFHTMLIIIICCD